MKKMKRILSAAMVLLLMATLPVNAFAAEWYMEDGDITVNAGSSGQTVTQGSNVDVPDAAPVITQYDSSTATSNTVTINAESGATAEVTLDGVNIDASNTGEAAVSTSGEGDVTIELDNSNTVQSGSNHAGLEKNNTGTLTITDTDNNGSLDATGGEYGAGIGGGDSGDGSNITITGGNVTAQGGYRGAGIGGGDSGDGINIAITGGEVSATGGPYSAGVGGGYQGTGESIAVSGDAHLNVQITLMIYYASGAAIGDGAIDYDYSGKDVAPNTDELTADGEINYFNCDVDMTKATPQTSIHGSHEHDWDEGVITTPATCTKTGVMTYTCQAGNDFTKTEEIPATGEHTWENGKCSVCGEPQPAPTPVLADSDTQSAPLYRVTDKDGKNISYKAEQKDGVLTITVDADFAILTGTLSGINTLKAQGVEKIVFVTKNTTSTFTLADLLAKGSLGETYKLTHDGKTVTFTLGAKSTDVSDILEKA